MPLSPPTYDGLALFGAAVRVRPGSGRRDGQRNTFGGLDGVEFLDMGDRGRETSVSFRVFGSGPDDFNAAVALIESYRDNVARTLTDGFGNEWPNAVLAEFEPEDELRGVVGGGLTQRFRAKFEQLTSS